MRIAWHLAVIVGVMLAGNSQGQTIPNVPDADLTDYSSILKLGEAGDRNQAPLLQIVFKAGRGEGEGRFSRSAAAQMVLARLGDEQAMKSVICELRNHEDLDEQNEAFMKLRYIGGYSSIRILSRFLDNAEVNTRIRRYPDQHGDYGTLAQLAREALEAIVHPPFQMPPAMGVQEQGENKVWLQYLREHDSELKLKAPVFEFDDVGPEECKQIALNLSSHKPDRTAGSCGYLAEILQFAEGQDPNKVFKLQAVLRSGNQQLCSRSASAQIALARIGDEVAMKSILCEIEDDRAPDRQERAFRKLGYVGGYTAIRVVSRFLDRPTVGGASGVPKNKDKENTEYARLSHLAISAIANIIHQDPFQLPPPRSAREIEGRGQLWRKWVDAHDTDLRKRNPIYSFQHVESAECARIKTDMSRHEETK